VKLGEICGGNNVMDKGQFQSSSVFSIVPQSYSFTYEWSRIIRH